MFYFFQIILDEYGSALKRPIKSEIVDQDYIICGSASHLYKNSLFLGYTGMLYDFFKSIILDMLTLKAGLQPGDLMKLAWKTEKLMSA